MRHPTQAHARRRPAPAAGLLTFAFAAAAALLATVAAPAAAQSYDPGFRLKIATEWYLEVEADAESVQLVVDGSDTYDLEATGWGTFTRGGHLPEGTTVELIARRGGATARTRPFAYLQEEPALASSAVEDGGGDGGGGEAPAYDPGFRIRNSSEWWLEVAADADRMRVEIEGRGEAMSPTDWGSFVRGGHLPRGTTLRLIATKGTARAESAPFAYLVEEPSLASSSGDPDGGGAEAPADPPAGFEARFVDVRGNNWWIQVGVESGEPVQAVHVRPRGGAWTDLDRQSWGEVWATSFYVAPGTVLEFRATSESGALAYSGGYRWPDAVPVDGSGAGDGGSGDGSGTGSDGGTTYPSETHSPITSAVLGHMRAVAANAPGRDDHVFAKVGDSISVGWPFLFCFADDAIQLDGRSYLQPSIDWFRRGNAAGTTPFNRASEATNAGWTAYATLNKESPSVIEQELAAINPRFAVVMLGTNDAGWRSPSDYQRDMTGIIDQLEENGVIPILSTIPPIDNDSASAAAVPALNRVIRDLAARRNLPLMDLHRELSRLPDHGLRDDGVHLSTNWNRYIPGSCDFTDAGLNWGTNVRNLVTMEALHRVRTAFVENRTVE